MLILPEGTSHWNMATAGGATVHHVPQRHLPESPALPPARLIGVVAAEDDGKDDGNIYICFTYIYIYIMYIYIQT